MKLLFDQNISFRLIEKIADFFPEARQVVHLGLTNATDLQIWNFAKENGYAIVTFDADFYELASIKGHPPKIIWLRTGNRTTNSLARLFFERKDVIREFLEREEYKDITCLELL